MNKIKIDLTQMQRFKTTETNDRKTGIFDVELEILAQVKLISTDRWLTMNRVNGGSKKRNELEVVTLTLTPWQSVGHSTASHSQHDTLSDRIKGR